MPYTYEEIHKLLDKADERERMIVLLLASSGVRRGALPELKYGDLKWIEQYQIYEITVYKGFKEEYVTYCSSECAYYINSYLDFRRRNGEQLTPDSYLIRKQFDTTNHRWTIKVSNATDPPQKHKTTMRNLESIIYHLIYDSGIRGYDENCERNPQVSRYLGSRRKLRDNVKLRPILDTLQNHSQVKMVRMKPAVLEYMHGSLDSSVSGDIKNEPDEAVVCDPCDACDSQSDTHNKNLQKNNDEHLTKVSGDGSHASHTSHSVYELEARDTKQRDIRDVIARNRESVYPIKHSNKWACKYCTVKADRQLMEIHVCSESKKNRRASKPTRKNDSSKTVHTSNVADSIKPYEHLIETEYLPNLDRTVYRCKEHPEVPYYDLEGIKESHFKPFHKI
jgi:hypothetical protein